MKKIYFVTTNEGKVVNAQKALGRFGIQVKPIKIEMPESRAENPRDIAIEKAKYAYAKMKKPVIVEDSGFFIRALSGFPMTHVKFSLQTLGIDNILKMLDGVKDRHAEWRMTVAYCWGKDRVKSFTFVEKGEIAQKKRNKKREPMSDYWYIYIPKMIRNNKALIELTKKDLDQWQEYYSKNNQFQKFGKWFAKQID